MSDMERESTCSKVGDGVRRRTAVCFYVFLRTRSLCQAHFPYIAHHRKDERHPRNISLAGRSEACQILTDSKMTTVP